MVPRTDHGFPAEVGWLGRVRVARSVKSTALKPRLRPPDQISPRKEGDRSADMYLTLSLPPCELLMHAS